MKIVGTSKAVALAIAKAKGLATTKEPCLITGAVGSGKTHLARFIHKNSRREAEPFVVFDIAEHESIEKALFGFVKTSILGTDNMTAGAIDATGAGTLFIKNLHLLPMELQPQISATVQLGGYKPRGAEESLISSCRFIFSMPPITEKLIEERKLIPELLQTFSKTTVNLSPLKERAEDIEPLANYFLSKWCENLNLPSKKLSKSALKLLKKYTWPKNISELQLIILNSAISFNGREINAEHLQLKLDGNWHPHTEEHLEQIALEELIEKKIKQFMQRLGKYDVENLHSAIIERVERPLIKLAMERSKNNQLKAAKILGINRNTLRTKLQKLGML